MVFTRKDLKRFKKAQLLKLARENDFGFKPKTRMTKGELVEKIFKSPNFKKMKDTIPKAEKRQFSEKQLEAQRRFKELSAKRRTNKKEAEKLGVSTEDRVKSDVNVDSNIEQKAFRKKSGFKPNAEKKLVKTIEEKIVDIPSFETTTDVGQMEVQQVAREPLIPKKPQAQPVLLNETTSSDPASFQAPLVLEEGDDPLNEAQIENLSGINIEALIPRTEKNAKVLDALQRRLNILRPPVEPFSEEKKEEGVEGKVVEPLSEEKLRQEVPREAIQRNSLARGQLNRMNIPDLQGFLRHKEQPTEGSKQELVDRIIASNDIREVEAFIDNQKQLRIVRGLVRGRGSERGFGARRFEATGFDIGDTKLGLN